MDDPGQHGNYKKLTQCHLENDPGASPADVLYLRCYCEGRGCAGFRFAGLYAHGTSGSQNGPNVIEQPLDNFTRHYAAGQIEVDLKYPNGGNNRGKSRILSISSRCSFVSIVFLVGYLYV